MLKKILPIAIIIALLSILVIVFISIGNKTMSAKTESMAAVPLDAGLIIECRDFNHIVDELQGNADALGTLSKSNMLSNLEVYIKNIDSILNYENGLKKIFVENPLILSAHISGQEKADWLFTSAFANKLDKESFESSIKSLFRNEKINKTRVYNKVKVFTINNQQGDKKFSLSYCFYNHHFLASRSDILLESAIRQLDNDVSILDTPEFQKIRSYSGANSPANIYLNFQILTDITKTFTNRERANKLEFLKHFSNWSEYDIKIKKNLLSLNGICHVNDQLDYFINLSKDQQAQKKEISSILPGNCLHFSSFGLENINNYLEDFEQFISNAGSATDYKKTLNRIHTNFSFDIKSSIIHNISNEFGNFSCKLHTAGDSIHHFNYIKTISPGITQSEYSQFIKDHAKNIGENAGHYIFPYSIDDIEITKIFKLPFTKLCSSMFGEFFSSCSDKYLCFIDKFMVFGDSKESLEYLIYENELEHTLANQSNFKKFKENISDKSNILFYFRPAEFILNQELFNSSVARKIDIPFDLADKFSMLSLEFVNRNNIILSNLYVNFDEEVFEKPETIWERHLDGDVVSKPAIVLNHNTKEKEILIQDEFNTIYLINISGRILWSLPIEERINSEVYQIDFYKNGKLQLLFSTKNKIHLIDRLGNYVDKYPLSLRSPSSTGINLFDYDNNKNYRIFIAGDDQKIYAYDKKGSLVKGWNLFKTENPVLNPPQHIRVLNKDYILVGDQLKTYLLDRRGNIRVPLQTMFNKSKAAFYLQEPVSGAKACLLTTNTEGAIIKIGFDGTVESSSLEKISETHDFIAADVDSDGKLDYIFTDQSRVFAYNSDKNLLFSKEIKNAQLSDPHVYSFSQSNKKIGLIDKSNDKLYLFDIKGNLHPGFPLKGNTPFSIGYMNPNSNNFSLITGSKNKNLYYYKVK